MTITKQQMKDAVNEVANELAQNTGNITTLDLKNALRTKYPAIMWNQYGSGRNLGVSDLFHELVNEGNFRSIANNGTYQTYVPTRTQKATAKTLVTAIAKANPAPKKAKKVATVSVAKTKTASKSTISRTKALDLMQNNKGHFFTVEFIKKEDGSLRKLNGQYVKDQTMSALGYVKVKEASKMKQGVNAIRNVNLQTLQSLKVGGVLYNIK